MVDTATAPKGRPVVVCTELRGVFFGYAEDTDGEAIKLKSARNAIYWSKATQGVVGLAGIGPQDGSRIGARADIELRKISAILECTPEATALWEAAKWG
jgi:hypothetical protein